jgi:DNA-binding response OmpR family regulator
LDYDNFLILKIKRQLFMPKEILIVDDEPGVVVPIQYLMEQQGYRVMIAERGEDALDLIYQYKPDLVLLDIMLPGIDGYEVCEIVRLNPDYRNVKIIFLTAKGREEEIAKGLALGADAYITKPYSNAELVARVKELLKKASEEAGE